MGADHGYYLVKGVLRLVLLIHLDQNILGERIIANGVLKDQITAIPVTVVEKDRFAGIAAKDDMVVGVGIMNAGLTSHGGKIAANVRKSWPQRLKNRNIINIFVNC